MALILKHGILYLHVPKTGGNWVTRVLRQEALVLGEIGHKHATWDAVCARRTHGLRRRLDKLNWRLRPAPGGLPAQPTVVCVVRHPLRWYESWFRYQTKHRWKDRGTQGDLRAWHVNSDLNSCASTDFETFMRNVNRERPGYVSQLFARYTFNSACHVLRNESLAADLLAFLEDHGVQVSRERILSAQRYGESPAMELEWAPDVLAETVANERPAFRAYGYEPDSSSA